MRWLATVLRRHGAVPLATVLMIFLAPAGALQASPAPWPDAPSDEYGVACVLSAADEGTLGEVYVDGHIVLRLRAGAGGLEVGQRCAAVVARLLAVTADGQVPDILPGVMGDQVIVQAGGQVLVTVVEEAARLNGTSRAVLAWIWANNLRAALGLEPLPLSAAPYQGLPGVVHAEASWYGPAFAGRSTASGEIFDPSDLTAAHRRLPFGSLVRVIAPWSGEQVIVRINDRGPWIPGRDIDLSMEAARRLGLMGRGVSMVLLEVVRVGPPR